MSRKSKPLFVAATAASLLVATIAAGQQGGGGGGGNGAGGGDGANAGAGAGVQAGGSSANSAQAAAAAAQGVQNGAASLGAGINGNARAINNRALNAAQQATGAFSQQSTTGSATSNAVRNRANRNSRRSTLQMNNARNTTRPNRPNNDEIRGRATNRLDNDELPGAAFNRLDNNDIDIDLDDDDGTAATGQRNRNQMRRDANTLGRQGTEMQNRSFGNTREDTDEEIDTEILGHQGTETNSQTDDDSGETDFDENGIRNDSDAERNPSSGDIDENNNGGPRPRPWRRRTNDDLPVPPGSEVLGGRSSANRSNQSANTRANANARNRSGNASNMPVRPGRDHEIPGLPEGAEVLGNSGRRSARQGGDGSFMPTIPDNPIDIPGIDESEAEVLGRSSGSRSGRIDNGFNRASGQALGNSEGSNGGRQGTGSANRTGRQAGQVMGNSLGSNGGRQGTGTNLPTRPNNGIDIPGIDEGDAEVLGANQLDDGTQQDPTAQNDESQTIGATDLRTRARNRNGNNRFNTSARGRFQSDDLDGDGQFDADAEGEFNTPRRPTNDQIPGRATGRPDNDELPGRAFDRLDDDTSANATTGTRRNQRPRVGANRNSPGIDNDGFSDLRTRTGRNMGTRFDTDRPETMRDGSELDGETGTATTGATTTTNNDGVEVNTDFDSNVNGEVDGDTNADLSTGLNTFDVDSLGVNFGTDSSDRLMISRIRPNSILAQAGVERGDTLVSLLGRNVRSMSDLQNVLQTVQAGDRIPLVVLRNGRQQRLVLDSNDLLSLSGQRIRGNFRTSANMRNTGLIDGGGAWLGLALDNGINDRAVVQTIQSGSAAQRAGLRIGDVITRVNGQRITSSQQLAEIISQLDPEQSIQIDVARGGSQRFRATVNQNDIQ